MSVNILLYLFLFLGFLGVSVATCLRMFPCPQRKEEMNGIIKILKNNSWTIVNKSTIKNDVYEITRKDTGFEGYAGHCVIDTYIIKKNEKVYRFEFPQWNFGQTNDIGRLWDCILCRHNSSLFELFSDNKQDIKLLSSQETKLLTTNGNKDLKRIVNNNSDLKRIEEKKKEILLEHKNPRMITYEN